MAEMKNICGKIPLDLHEKVRAEIELKESSTQLFIQQVIEEHFNRLEGKGENHMEKRTLAVQISEELFQRVKWAVAKERVKQKDFIIAIIEKAVEEVEAKWQELERTEPEEEALPLCSRGRVNSYLKYYLKFLYAKYQLAGRRFCHLRHRSPLAQQRGQFVISQVVLGD